MIHHLALRHEWEEAAARGGPYDRSTLGRSRAEVGFVHCSFAHQVGRIADLVYRDHDDVLLLTLDEARLDAEVRVENLEGGDEGFPHVYGPVPLDAVVAATPVPSRDGALRTDEALSAAAFAVALEAAPRGPGVYAMLDDHDRLLYIGMAVDVRRRLSGHQRDARRGGWRATEVRDIRWEVQADADAAAAREADLVVALHPPRNKALVGDARFSYVVAAPVEGGRLRLCLATQPRSAGAARVHGAFPHLGAGLASVPGTACADGYAALLRLLWAAGDGRNRRARMPARLASGSPPADVTLAVDQDVRRPLHDFLAGTSRRLLDQLAPSAAAQVQAHQRPALARDADAADRFFRFGPAAVRAFRRRHRLPSGPVERTTWERLLAAELRESIGSFELQPEPASAGGRRRTRSGWLP